MKLVTILILSILLLMVICVPEYITIQGLKELMGSSLKIAIAH